MKVSAALPTGVAALLFESARARRALEGRLAALVESHGYAEAILPILDYVEPYEALLTPASRGELYRFIDRDGEELALRADFTPMLARLLAPRLDAAGAAEATEPGLPLRLFYRGDVVRYGGGGASGGGLGGAGGSGGAGGPGGPRGWRRELYQLGVERLTPAAAGEAETAAGEREVLGLFLAALAATAGPKQVVLGLAGCLDAALLSAVGEAPAAVAAAVARRERGLVRRACPLLLPVVESGLPRRPEDLGAAAAERLRLLVALREEMAARFPGVALTVDLAEFALHCRDPRLTAGAGGSGGGGVAGARTYYDGLVFRAYAGAAAVPAGGGGRYGALFRALGADIDAVGFSLNLDGLIEAAAGVPGRAGGRGNRGDAGGAGDDGDDGNRGDDGVEAAG